MRKIILLFVLLICACACTAQSVIVEEFVGKDVHEVYQWCGQLDDNYSCEVVYEDNDDYQKDIVFEQSVQAGKKLKGDIMFKVASGAEAEIPLPFISPELTQADVEIWRDIYGIKNLTFTYEANDTVEKNHVIRMEPSSHITKETPITAYISSGSTPSGDGSVEIHYGDFLNLTVSEFESKAKSLGLNPNHQESRDRYDADIKQGNIVWHGSGTYEKGEIFNYGVCIYAIQVKPSEYVGKSESEFIKIAADLKLVPKHIDDRDAYSTSIDKGYIVTHGNGLYVENEEFKYGISRGPANVTGGYEGAKEGDFINYLAMLELKGDRRTSSSTTVSSGRIISYNYGKYSTGDYVTYYLSTGPEDTSVDVPSFEGADEKAFLAYLSNNGLYAGDRYEVTSTYARGTIVSNDTGKKNKGDRINYTVSSSQKETAIIEAFDTVREQVSHDGDYEQAEYDMKRYLFGRCFMDYEIIPVVKPGTRAGWLQAIYIDGEPLDYAQSVPLDAHIECQISTLLMGN